MAPTDWQIQRVTQAEAEKQLRLLLKADASIVYTKHAKDQMADRKVSSVDVENILKQGAIKRPGEPKFGRYSYCAETSKGGVAFAFKPDGSGIVIVTTWWDEKGRSL